METFSHCWRDKPPVPGWVFFVRRSRDACSLGPRQGGGSGGLRAAQPPPRPCPAGRAAEPHLLAGAAPYTALQALLCWLWTGRGFHWAEREERRGGEDAFVHMGGSGTSGWNVPSGLGRAAGAEPGPGSTAQHWEAGEALHGVGSGCPASEGAARKEGAIPPRSAFVLSGQSARAPGGRDPGPSRLLGEAGRLGSPEVRWGSFPGPSGLSLQEGSPARRPQCCAAETRRSAGGARRRTPRPQLWFPALSPKLAATPGRNLYRQRRVGKGEIGRLSAGTG